MWLILCLDECDGRLEDAFSGYSCVWTVYRKWYNKISVPRHIRILYGGLNALCVCMKVSTADTDSVRYDLCEKSHFFYLKLQNKIDYTHPSRFIVPYLWNTIQLTIAGDVSSSLLHLPSHTYIFDSTIFK